MESKLLKKLLTGMLVLSSVYATAVMNPLNMDSVPVMEVQVKTKVKLNRTSQTLVKGKTATLKISGTKKKVKWSTSNKKVATVTSKGKVTAKGVGTAYIYAKVSGKTYKCKIKVENPLISKTSAVIYKGGTYTLKVNGNTQKITWSSSNKNVVSVSSKGKVTAKKAGTAYISAKVAGKTMKCKITVKNPVAITKISLNKNSLSLNTESSYKLSAAISPSNTTQSKNVKWTSSNTAVASVSNSGTVTAKKAGTATITAQSSNGKKATCKVTSVQPAPAIVIESIVLDKTQISLEVNESYKLSAAITPSNTTQSKTIVWSSSNNAVASVSSSGKVYGAKAGEATITAKASNGKTAVCKVTVTSMTAKISTEAIDTVNKEREKLGVKPYKRNAKLDEIALKRAYEIAEVEYSHDGIHKYDTDDARAIGECIAYGFTTGKSVVIDGWKNSESHWNLLMREYYAEISIARYGDYWVAVVYSEPAW